jgi:hypothetical protein
MSLWHQYLRQAEPVDGGSAAVPGAAEGGYVTVLA